MLDGQISYVALNIDMNKYTKYLEKEVNIQLRQAVRAWLRVLVEEGTIPVWTGTAKGVFIPLGRFLRIAVPISPTEKRKGFGPSVGADRSAFSFVRNGNSYSFEFVHSVQYLADNDQKNMNPPFNLINPGPYHAFEKAGKAYDDYVDKYFEQRLDVIAKATRSREYTIG